jgi:chaperone modulatory protein CbpM
MTHQLVLSQVSVHLLDEHYALTLDELCRACAANAGLITALVDEGVLAPHGTAPDSWRFSGVHLKRASVALRLQRDLGVNLAGAALALQLLEEVEELRSALRRRMELAD